MTDNERQNGFADLYRRAFRDFGVQALWNKRLLEEPPPQDALVIARALRKEGNLKARQLAQAIEQPCTPVLEWSVRHV